jgi:hypothetical protein
VIFFFFFFFFLEPHFRNPRLGGGLFGIISRVYFFICAKEGYCIATYA